LRAAGVEPAAIRLAILAHHYRDDWEWTDQSLTDAQERLARWRSAAARPEAPDSEAVVAAARERLANDLDAPGMLRLVDAWAGTRLASGADDPSLASAPTPSTTPAHGFGAHGLVPLAVDALLGVRL
jgi:L-cysteine:1D-myo-inositol 2-amino-2-deoxy-alpha-D-glucopyranoside ligase